MTICKIDMGSDRTLLVDDLSDSRHWSGYTKLAILGYNGHPATSATCLGASVITALRGALAHLRGPSLEDVVEAYGADAVRRISLRVRAEGGFVVEVVVGDPESAAPICEFVHTGPTPGEALRASHADGLRYRETGHAGTMTVSAGTFVRVAQSEIDAVNAECERLRAENGRLRAEVSTLRPRPMREELADYSRRMRADDAGAASRPLYSHVGADKFGHGWKVEAEDSLEGPVVTVEASGLASAGTLREYDRDGFFAYLSALSTAAAVAFVEGDDE